METRIQIHKYAKNGVKRKSIQHVKDLAVTIAYNQKFPQHCKDAFGKANKIPGFITNKFCLRIVKICLPLNKGLVRPYLYIAVQIFWHHLANIQSINRRPSLRNISYEEADTPKYVLSRGTLPLKKPYSVL